MRVRVGVGVRVRVRHEEVTYELLSLPRDVILLPLVLDALDRPHRLFAKHPGEGAHVALEI